MDLWLERDGFIETQKMATRYVALRTAMYKRYINSIIISRIQVKRKYIYTKS